MTNHKWTDRLSEYLDGELNRADREALEAHLAECAECSAVVEELRAVTGRARSLDDRPPAHDLWAGIAQRIGAASAADLQSPRPDASAGSAEPRSIDSAPRRRGRFLARRITLGLPQLAAAAITLVVLSGAGMGALLEWRASGAASGRAGTAASGGAGVLTVANISELGGARYDSAVAELEQALAANMGNLDSSTVRIIKQNIAIIDQAIDQGQRALAADPANPYLSNHLAGTLRRKVELLRRATALNAVQS